METKELLAISNNNSKILNLFLVSMCIYGKYEWCELWDVDFMSEVKYEKIRIAKDYFKKIT